MEEPSQQAQGGIPSEQEQSGQSAEEFQGRYVRQEVLVGTDRRILLSIQIQDRISPTQEAITVMM